jgi:REP element-mobilizing transposase RayT
VGAAQAFETALMQVVKRYEWRLHAYVLMTNHYHLALETPKPNLVDGMHWLQSTFATRFNRLLRENAAEEACRLSETSQWGRAVKC